MADCGVPDVAVIEAGTGCATVMLTVAAAEAPSPLLAVNWKLSAPL